MGNFKIIKKGYSQLEVDSYIERLKNDYETKLSEQKDRIFYLKDELDKLKNSSDNELMTSLLSAVEKAKLIENSSKNIYELETKKLSLLYSKMENLLNDENICNDRSIKDELLLLIKDCRRSLQNNIEMQTRNIKESSSGDPIKRLLSKMIVFNKLPSDTIEDIDDNKSSSTKLIENKQVEPLKVVQIKRQDKSKTDNKEFNDFLNSNMNVNGSNFENILFSKKTFDYSPNESGFDLKEAVNPKEDLDEIMKAFDFYNNTKKESDK